MAQKKLMAPHPVPVTPRFPFLLLWLKMFPLICSSAYGYDLAQSPVGSGKPVLKPQQDQSEFCIRRYLPRA